MSKPRLGHTATFDGVKYLLAGGQTSDGTVLNTADLWTPGTGLAGPSAHTMVSSRVYQTATAITNPSCETGQILLAGGRERSRHIQDAWVEWRYGNPLCRRNRLERCPSR